MGRAGLGRAAETSWAVFVLGVFLFSWFSRQTTWEVVGPEPGPPPYGTGGVRAEEAGVPEPGCLKESLQLCDAEAITPFYRGGD